MQLSFRDVSKAYGSNLALQHFSADLAPGIYALLGPNGSGKSTLMNILTDNLASDAGEIFYTSEDGKTEEIRAMGTRFRAKIGFMPQYPGLYPNFTVERFMWYMAALKGMTRAVARAQIPVILSAMELDDIHCRRIGALSGGMKQRLTLAQAVLGAPEILILDEPTAGLDPKQRIAIRNYIAEIAFNKIVIIATHVVPDVEYIAREVIILKKGTIVDHAPPHVLTESIKGQVWNVPCNEAEVSAMQAHFRVTNITREGDDICLRVLSDCRPTDAAIITAPTLEDYYLYVFSDSMMSR